MNHFYPALTENFSVAGNSRGDGLRDVDDAGFGCGSVAGEEDPGAALDSMGSDTPHTPYTPDPEKPAAG